MACFAILIFFFHFLRDNAIDIMKLDIVLDNKSNINSDYIVRLVLTFLLVCYAREETKTNVTGVDEDEDGQTNPSEIGLPKDGVNKEKQVAIEAAQAKISSPTDPNASPFQLAKSALIQALRLFITPNMILLSIASVYTGWCQSFFFGVYPTSVGFTKRFGDDAKRLVGLVGIFTGVGEVVGGSAFGLLGSKTTKKGIFPC